MRPSSLLTLSEKFLVDVLFPRACFGCGKEGSFVCRTCKKNLKHLSFQNCPVCERSMTVSGEQCQHCKQNKDVPLKQLIVAGDYENELLAKTIHAYKYKFVAELSIHLGAYLTESLQKWISVTPDVLVPVPLHGRRLRWRGFNQSLLLAKYISTNLLPGIEIPIDEKIIRRKRNTAPQMQIKKHLARRQNIQNAFELVDDSTNLQGKTVLLVDDVCTTGATIFECSKEIDKLNPKAIIATVLARQSIN